MGDVGVLLRSPDPHSKGGWAACAPGTRKPHVSGNWPGTQEIKVMKRLALVLALAALAGPGDHHVSHQDVRRW